MSVFVDMVGFEGAAGHFIIKEMCILPLSSRGMKIIKIFTPPCGQEFMTDEYREIVEKSTSFSHGIAWDSGDTDYRDVASEIESSLVDKYDYIYVKGEKKKEWLITLLKSKSLTIIDLDDLSCPSDEVLQQQPSIRHMHVHTKCVDYVCVYENSQRYRSWFKKSFTFRPNLRKSIMHFCAVDFLCNMSKEDISMLPIIAIIKFAAHEIDNVWEKLSEEQQKHPVIVGCKRCKQHPIDFGNGDVFGCYLHPLIKDCNLCNKHNENDNNVQDVQMK